MPLERLLYENEPVNSLREVLYYRFNTVVEFKVLDQLRGYFVASLYPEEKNILAIKQESNDSQSVYLCIHSTCHVILGHAAQPFAKIFEPIMTNGIPAISFNKLELRQHEDAEILCRKILSKDNVFNWKKVRKDLGIDPQNDVLKTYISSKALLLKGALYPHTYPFIGEDSW